MLLTFTNAQGNRETRSLNSCMLLDTAALPDADIPPGVCQFWFDTTGDTIEAKFNDGGVFKTATIATLT